ncbi:hypothetical protein FS749_007255, partial [Ceratobasidium sp. UAMH 11750]
MYQITQTVRQDTLSIASTGGKYTVLLTFLSDGVAEQAYQQAFAKVGLVGNQPNVPKAGSRAGAAFKTLLALGGTMAELAPTAGAKEVFTICAKALQHIEAQDQQDVELSNFVQSLAGMIPSIESVKLLADAKLMETVMAMLNLIEDVSLFILSFKSRSSWARSLYSAVDPAPQERMQAFIIKFERLRKEFDTRVNVQAFGTQQIENARSKLQELKPAKLASYDSTRACMPGTRVEIIDDIVTWTHTPNEGRRLGWVHGLAGLGKSSIATSVCQQLDEQGILAASFFCKRDNPDLRDPCRVIATIAYHLALSWKPYEDAVVDVIRANPDLELRHIQPLYDALVSKPLRGIIQTSRPEGNLVTVVDALDECGDVESRRQILACLQDMSQIAPWLKIVVTSRPDVDIQEIFGRPSVDWFTAYNVLSYDALFDIRIFIQAQLKNVEHIKGWPSDAVNRLSDRSSGLFIWARTACKFIMDGHNPCKRLEQVLAGERLHDSSAQLDALYTTAVKAGALDDDEDNLASVLQCLGVVVATATRTPLSVSSLSNLLCGRVSEYTLNHVLGSLSSVLYLDYKQDGVVRLSHPSFMDYITNRVRSKELYVDLEEHNVTLAQCCLETMSQELRFNICDLEISHTLNCNVPGLDARVRDAIGPHLSYSCVYWTSHLTKARAGELEGPLRAFLFERQLLYWIEALSLLRRLDVAPPSLLELSRVPGIAKDCQSYAYDVYRFVLSFYEAISESTPHLYVSALALAPEKSRVARRMRSHFSNMAIVTEGAEQEWTPCLRVISAPDEVNSTATSPDGRRIATGSDDKMVRIWDAETGVGLLEPFQGHLGTVQSVAFSPNGLRIVSGSDDHTVRIWNAGTGALVLGPLAGHSDIIHSVAFSPDGSRVASGSRDRTMRMWDAETGAAKSEPLKGHTQGVLSVAFSPNGRRLVSGSADGTARLWDAETGAALFLLPSSYSGFVWSVAFSPDSRRIVSGSWDKTVRIWDAETGAAVLKLRGHSGYVRSVMFSPDGRCVVSGSKDKTVRVWDAETGAALIKPLRGHSDVVYSVAFLPSGRIVSGSGDKTTRIWDVRISSAASDIWPGHSDQTPPTAPSAGRTLAVSSFDGGTQLVENAQPVTTPLESSQGSSDNATHIGGATTDVVLPEPLQVYPDKVYSVAISPNGRRIASGSVDKTVLVWDAETGAALLAPLRGHSGTICSVSFSFDSRRIVSGSGDKTVRVWEAETGAAQLGPLRGDSGWVWSAVFSPNGQLIASASEDTTIRLWDAETGAMLLAPLRGHSGAVRSVEFSPDGRRIVSGSADESVRLWDAETGAALLVPLQGHSNYVRSVLFSPDGRRIVSGSWDRTVRVWDAETGATLLEPLQGHSSWVQSVRFSPDGRRIVSGSDDKTVRVWDADTGAELFEPLRGHSGYVWSVAFSPDNRHIISGSTDMTIRIWDTKTCVETHGPSQRCLP